jgi:hypothetical protein
MFKVTGTFEINSNNPSLAEVKDKVQNAFLVLSALHEPSDPLQIGTVVIQEVTITLTPVVEGGFFTDSLSIR